MEKRKEEKKMEEKGRQLDGEGKGGKEDREGKGIKEDGVEKRRWQRKDGTCEFQNNEIRCTLYHALYTHLVPFV